MEKLSGYVHVYTGNGKGKTTAALGLAIRAAGAGFQIFIGQFVKGTEQSEHKSIKRLSDFITIKQYGQKCFIFNKPNDEDILFARKGLEEIENILVSKKYRLVILDEVNIAVYYNLFSVKELLKIINLKPKNVELVITGRYAKQEIIDRADLVTEMCEVKHYYKDGVSARVGIEK